MKNSLNKVFDKKNRSEAAEKPRKSETYESVVKHVKRSVISGLAVSAVVIAIAAWSAMVPYAVTIDGETVCYVSNKTKAQQVTKTIIADYMPEGTTLKAVKMSDNVTIEKAGVLPALRNDCVSAKEAVAIIEEKLENPAEPESADVEVASTDAAAAAAGSQDTESKDDAKTPEAVTDEDPVEAADKAVASAVGADAESETAEKTDEAADASEAEDGMDAEAAESEEAAEPVDPTITILSTEQLTESYKAETEYIQDDSMLAGDSVVEAEGKEGTKDVIRQYTTINGEVVSTVDVSTEIIEEAEPKVVRKGTLGLPEGEDWQTYEGDPIFNDGDSLVQTALNYLGAPYKYGGHSLTTGIDCVQFIRQMYAKYGISLPNGKNALKHVGTAVSYANAQPGDIICYSNHYAIYMGNNKIVHATPHGGVSVRNNAKYRGIVTIRRIPRS